MVEVDSSHGQKSKVRKTLYTRNAFGGYELPACLGGLHSKWFWNPKFCLVRKNRISRSVPSQIHNNKSKNAFIPDASRGQCSFATKRSELLHGHFFISPENSLSGQHATERDFFIRLSQMRQPGLLPFIRPHHTEEWHRLLWSQTKSLKQWDFPIS